MFDFSRLSPGESIALKAMCTLVMGLIGFVLTTAFLVGLADAMTPDPIQGTAVPASTTSVCGRIDWQGQDVDGRVFVPFDANQDGMIDCESDIELGS